MSMVYVSKVCANFYLFFLSLAYKSTSDSPSLLAGDLLADER